MRHAHLGQPCGAVQIQRKTQGRARRTPEAASTILPVDTHSAVTVPYRSTSYRTGANQPNWRAPAKRVNNVDDPEGRSGAYFGGGWSDEETLDGNGGPTDVLDLGGSDWDMASKLRQSEGKGAQ